MPYRIKEFYPGGFYHIFNRGIDCQRIFFSDDNYLYCLKLLNKYSCQYNVSIVAYCLMPNHYHLILKQNLGKSISDLMQVVFNAYVQAVNKQIRRKGPLFEGRFKHIHIDQDNYILHLCRYIHLNPVKSKLVPSPDKWPYSNYGEWVGKKNRNLVNPVSVTSFFSNFKQYQQFVMDYTVNKEVENQVRKYILE